jgi:hypothetical protein
VRFGDGREVVDPAVEVTDLGADGVAARVRSAAMRRLVSSM